MALKDRIAFGMSLPHRSPDPIDVARGAGGSTARRGVGVQRSVVTENTLDHVTCFDPVVDPDLRGRGHQPHPARRIGGRAGGAQPADGGASVGDAGLRQRRAGDPRESGLGREHHYREFAVPEAGQVGRSVKNST